ncbi:unnamed protein product (macronuclear) [Paramecium tetraurelia]|uniref:Uncharacterized protein n=1 Tax=Paramecium tetraurelia TaxID=5888 RepID=A0EHJ2_PARTE|nr:uncharacterized protein GSPATT00027107001 [Paramecium tetraurelia]CAK94783.1 unnamed protein product [Paramecium tetraurelia]|eukprot:XP_001462156.1 hypothetical protein (macronuclear) [Paramecium tetraurelia strain d4-2]
MKNSYLLLIVAITLVHVHGLEESLTLMSLEQMNSLDTSQYDCSRPQSEFIQMENSLSQWQDLLEHKDYIDHDIKVLQGIQAKVGLKASHKQVIKSLSQLKLPKTSTKIGLAEVEALKQQCGCLKNSDDNCDALLKLLSYFILSLRNVQSQMPITSNNFITAGCGGTIDIKGDESCDTPQQPEPTTPTDVPSTDPVPQPTTDPVPDDQKDSEEPAEETTTEETVDTAEEEQGDQQPPVTPEETTQPEEGEADEKQPEEGSPIAEETEPAAAEEQEGSPEETKAEEGVDTPAAEEEAGVLAEEEGAEEQAQTAEEGAQEEVNQPEEEITEPEEDIEIQVPEEESEENAVEVAEEGQAAEEVQPESAEEGQVEVAEEGQAESAEEGVAEAVEETIAAPEEEELQIDEPAEEIDIEVPAEEEACEEEELDQEEEAFDEEAGEQAGEEASEEGSQKEDTQVPGETEEQAEGEQPGEEQQQQPDAEETESSVGEPLEFEEESNGEVPATEETTAPGEETAAPGEETAAPGEETAAPGEETAAPGEETTTTDEETTDAEESSVGDEPVPDDQQDEEQEVLPEGCRKVPEDVLDISWQSTEAVAVSDLPVTETQIIGLSFYFRWLSKFPDAVPEGLSQETKFFVAGLGNALKFYVGQGGFHFSSFDENGVETYKNAGHGDIEGQWVLVYFGISNQKVTGFAQIQGQDVETVEFDVNLTLDESYQLVIGGPDGDVKSFNGQIARVFAFNDELYTQATEFTQFVTKCYGIPKNIYSGKRLTIPIEKERTFVSPASFDYDSVFENKKPMLPDEYSASGWFKWEKPNDQNIWHSGFRWTTNNQETNQNFRVLGDRGLSFFVGDEDNLQGHVAFCTYSYKTANGKSKVNDCKMVKYGNKLTEWFYVYFGYSRHLNKAYGYMEFTHEMAQIEFKDVRHYFASKIYFYLGQDKFYPPFNGKVQGFMLNFFDGSYRTSSYDYTFGYFPRPVYEYDDSKELIPSEPVVKQKCPKVVEITVDNASDVLCALSSYLSAVAQGHDPASDPKAETFCFCLVYEEENATPELLMLAQIFGGKIKQKSPNVNSSIKKLLSRQNALLK